MGHHDLINRYGEYVSQVITGMFRLSYHNQVISSLMTYHRVCHKTNMTGTTGPVHPSGAPEFSIIFSGIRVARSLVFCEMFCRSLFVLCSVSFCHCIVCPPTYGF
jgi:hypothetical protein